MQAAIRRKTTIQPIEKDPNDYDLVVFVYPIWVHLMPPQSERMFPKTKTSWRAPLTLMNIVAEAIQRVIRVCY
jgi:hypothetical protein